MSMNISNVADFLAVSRDTYKGKYDEYKKAYEAEVKQIKQDFKPNTPRYAEEMQIDEKHIMLDLFSGNGVDIVLDYAGLIKSENILQGYIPLEKLEAYEEYIHLENSTIESQNTELEIIRGCQTNVIKSTLKSPEKYFDDVESVNDLLVMLRAELKARGLYNRVRLLVGNSIDKMLFWLKNYRIIRLVKRCAADNI